MVKGGYFFTVLIFIVVLAGMVVPGSCTSGSGFDQALNPGSCAICAVDNAPGQTSIQGSSILYNSGDLPAEKEFKQSLFEIPVLNDYIAVGTTILLSFSAVLFIGYFYSSRLKMTRNGFIKMIEERETLLSGVNERFNNTFAVISSLISMQILNSNEEETKQKLTEINNRILSISLVHKCLLQSEAVSKVNIHDVFLSLGEQMVQTYFLGKEINFKVKGNECLLDIDQAIPLSMVMNEIISNSLKYAFAGRVSGVISVEYSCENDKFELCVRDDGVGIPENLIDESQESLGLSLIRNLISLQLKGSADLTVESGTKWMITFPVKSEEIL